MYGKSCFDLICRLELLLIASVFGAPEFPSFISTDSNQKCYQCPPGYRLNGPPDCLASENGGINFPNCVACPEGYFLDSWSLDRQCKPKDECHQKENMEVIVDGTTTHNRVCCCADGSEWESNKRDYCSKIEDKCPPCPSPPNCTSSEAVVMCNVSQITQPTQQPIRTSVTAMEKTVKADGNNEYQKGIGIGIVIGIGSVIGIGVVLIFLFYMYKKKMCCFQPPEAETPKATTTNGDATTVVVKPNPNNGSISSGPNQVVMEGQRSREKEVPNAQETHQNSEIDPVTNPPNEEIATNEATSRLPNPEMIALDDLNNPSNEEIATNEAASLLPNPEIAQDDDQAKKEEQLKTACRELEKHMDLSEDFYNFAFHGLDLMHCEYSDIKSKHRTEWISSAMNKWKQKRGKNATPEALVEILRNIDLNQLADRIELPVNNSSGSAATKDTVKEVSDEGNTTEEGEKLLVPASERETKLIKDAPSSDSSAHPMGEVV